MRGLVTPLRGSKTPVPVEDSALAISTTVAAGKLDFRTAHAPATCGAAIDVPAAFAKPPPGTDDSIQRPGASSDRY